MYRIRKCLLKNRNVGQFCQGRKRTTEEKWIPSYDRFVLGKYWSSELFVASLLTEPQAGSINLRKKERAQYFSSTDRTSEFNKVFIIMALFRISRQRIASFFNINARSNETKTFFFFLSRHFRRSSAKMFGQTTRKRFLLNAKMFPFEYLFFFFSEISS